jgi:hypothetical protein
MKDVFTRCSKKMAVQVCTVVLYAHSHVMSCVLVICLQFLMFKETDSQYWLVFIFRRLKINHDSHEFTLESGTVANRNHSLFLTCEEKKQVTHASSTWVELYLSNYSILQATTQIVVLHSYILEQLVFAVPCECVHLCLAQGKDCLPFHVVGLCYPPPLPGLAWLLGLACPGFCYQLAPSSCFHKSHIQVFLQLSHEV